MNMNFSKTLTRYIKVGKLITIPGNYCVTIFPGTFSSYFHQFVHVTQRRRRSQQYFRIANENRSSPGFSRFLNFGNFIT